MKIQGTILFTLLVLAAFSGGVSAIRLADHPLEGRRVAILTQLPDAPFADFDMTVFDRVGSEAPVPVRGDRGGSLEPLVLESINEGNERKEREGLRTPAHVLIDSVLAERPMNEAIIALTGKRAAQTMRFEYVESAEEADYILEIDIEDYGIGSDGWDAPLFFEIMARLTLSEAETGDVVWKDQVLDMTPVARALLEAGIPPDHTASPAALARTTYQDAADILMGLANYTAQQLTAPLQEAYSRSVDRERAYLE
jgi:hypothetical protein